MEIFGGFMVMMSIIGLFLAVVWLIMPFVVFAIKGKQDRMLELLETLEKRLVTIEALLLTVETKQDKADPAGDGLASAALSTESSCRHPLENTATPTEPAIEKNSPEVLPAV